MQRDDAVGRLPRGYKLGRLRCWLREKIDQWLADHAHRGRSGKHARRVEGRATR